MSLALQLQDATQWSDAIKAADNSRIYPVVNPNTGEFSGVIRPYNEYFLVAYIANLTSAAGSKANQYFETYYSTSGQPAGDGTNPVVKNYWGYDLLTDNPGNSIFHDYYYELISTFCTSGIFMSSFIPQFNTYLSRGYQNNQFYMDMNTRWLKADKLFWSKALSSSSTIWGNLVQNITWGAGAGM